MADLITIKSGSFNGRSTMPRLSVDEIGYQKDEQALYIGTESGNVRLCGADDVKELNTKLDEIITRLEALEPSE